MKVIWSNTATEDLTQAAEFIVGDDPEKAERLAARILELCRKLSQQPHIGRPGRTGTTRELVVRDLPFIIIYEVVSGRIEVTRILHTSREYS